MSLGFNFILTGNSSNGLVTNSETDATLLSSNETPTEASLLTNTDGESGLDAFGGKDIFGTVDYSNMDQNLFANAGTAEAAGSIAYGAAEAAGSIAYGTETMGSVACGSAEAAGSVACGGGDSGAGGGGGFSSMC